MNYREAKRLACFRAAVLLQSTLDNGWDTEGIVGGEQARLLSERWKAPRIGDRNRFLDALAELIAELPERGGA